MSPEIEVEAPTRRPLPYGLFSAASERTEDRRWRNGVEWQSVGCGSPFVTGAVCEDVAEAEKSDGLGAGEASPCTVHAPRVCEPASRPDLACATLAEAVARAS